MLDLKPEKLIVEIRAAQEFIRPYNATRKTLIEATAGPHYGTNGVKAQPENYGYAFKSFIGPQLIFGSPTCTVTPKSDPLAKETADGLQLAIERWSKETAWKNTLLQIRDDVMVAYGVTKCGVEPRGDYASGGLTAVQGDFEQRPNYPFCVRIDPNDFLIDPDATTITNARFIGHSFERDLDDIRADDRYDRAKTAMLNESPREWKNGTDTMPDRARANEDRKRTTLFELYIPESARLLTVAETGRNDCMILRDVPYFGPDEGPYTLWGLDSIAGKVMPISPLVALWDQIEKVNEHARDAAKSAETHKKILAYTPAGKKDAAKIKNAGNGDMVQVQDITSVKDLELGGVGKEQIEYTEIERARTDRNLGFNDAQRGQATPDTTATEAQIADASSDHRISGYKDRIRDCVTDVYRKIGWYFFNDSSIAPMEMMHTNEATGQQVGMTFFPGNDRPGAFISNTWIDAPPETDYADYELDVVADSIGKQNDALRMKREQDKFALMMQAAPMIGQLPFVNWKQAFAELGKIFNDRTFADRILNLDALAQMGIGLYPQPGMAGAGGQLPQRQASPASMPGLLANARGGPA